MPSANFYAVSGNADTDPRFPDDPFIAANRRVIITLREVPPLPPGSSSPKRRRPPLRRVPAVNN